MSSTNKTANLALPQWIESDKPTFLGDFNSAFLAIDTNAGTTKTTAETAQQIATEANQTANTATSDIVGIKSDVQLLKTNQTAINQHLTDVDNDIAGFQTFEGTINGQLTSSAETGGVPFKFGIDSDGNYGYIKAGADSVTPFLKKNEIGSFYSQIPESEPASTSLPKTGLNLSLEKGRYLVVAFVSQYTTAEKSAEIDISVNNGTYTKKDSNVIYPNGSGTGAEPTLFLLDVLANDECVVSLNTNDSKVIGCCLKAWKEE